MPKFKVGDKVRGKGLVGEGFVFIGYVRRIYNYQVWYGVDIINTTYNAEYCPFKESELELITINCPEYLKHLCTF